MEDCIVVKTNSLQRALWKFMADFSHILIVFFPQSLLQTSNAFLLFDFIDIRHESVFGEGREEQNVRFSLSGLH